MTHQVVTRWYRAPELLFGARHYGEGVDAWALGCVLAELLLRNPFLPGASDIDQLHKIAHCRGTPTERNWPRVSALRDFVPLPHFAPTPWREMFVAADDDTLALLDGLMALDPTRRLSAQQALAMPFFTRVSDAQWREYQAIAEAHIKKLPAVYDEQAIADKAQETAKATTKSRVKSDMQLDDTVAKKLF